MAGVNITPEVTYWVRDTQGGWHTVPSETAAWIVGTPKGGYAKIQTRRPARTRKKQTIVGEIEVALLAAMPPEYTKSDMRGEQAPGATLWDWALGPKSCEQVRREIDDRIRDDLRREDPPRYVRLYETMRDLLCSYRPKGVELREIKQDLVGPFTIEGEGEENIYFTDGAGENYFFKHHGSEAQRSGLFKAIGVKAQRANNPGTASGLVGRLKF